jgi:hypothetical protein
MEGVGVVSLGGRSSQCLGRCGADSSALARQGISYPPLGAPIPRVSQDAALPPHLLEDLALQLERLLGDGRVERAGECGSNSGHRTDARLGKAARDRLEGSSVSHLSQ